jgi:fructose-1,6-bisphosphatase I
MKPLSLTQFISEQAGASESLSLVLDDIISACQQIADLVHKGDLTQLLGDADSENVQGEIQKKLDIITHDIFVEALINNPNIAGLASEENDEIIPTKNHHDPKGKYLILFDPLDGSSNIDINMSVGSIFSILRCKHSTTLSEADFLQPGNQQIAAGFVLYGPSTMMILTTGQGVNAFTLNPQNDEFILTHPNIVIAENTSEFAINMSNQRFWEKPVQHYINECVLGCDGPREKNFNMRWIASLVAEVYRILTRGGIFLYPRDNHKSKSGRLRLMYEANPIAFLVQQAGGDSSTGQEQILDIQPRELHQRVPLILGAKQEVQRLKEYHQSSL